MRRVACAMALLALVLAGCDDMAKQPKDKANAMRDPPAAGAPAPAAGTVAHDAPADGVPPLSLAVIARGRERFDIACSPCHGRDGYGKGMIVERGFPAPPSFHVDRLRDALVGHFVDVIANGHGAMSSYAARVAPADRWAIAAYIRALQASQDTPVAALDDAARSRLP